MKRFKIRAESLLLVCAVASFCGWLTENVFRALASGRLDSRGQLLPFIAVYGFGVALLYALFGLPLEMRFLRWRILPKENARNRALRGIVYAAVTFCLILVSEAAVGLFFERVFGIRGWNYTNIPLHITRYTSVPTTAGFTLGVFLFMQFALPWLSRRFDRLPRLLRTVLAWSLFTLIVYDFLLMLLTAARTGSVPVYWALRW